MKAKVEAICGYYHFSKAAPTKDKATIGAVTALRILLPKETASKPNSIALSTSLSVHPPSGPVAITIDSSSPSCSPLIKGGWGGSKPASPSCSPLIKGDSGGSKLTKQSHKCRFSPRRSEERF